MSEAKFIENFLAAVDFQNPVDITLETALESLSEWDSLAALGVIVMFDSEYSKVITGEDIEKSVTVGDLYKLLG